MTSAPSPDLLHTGGISDPDLLIRTSGEYRVSNFLLWQIAYSEIWVTDRFWPDFRTTDLLDSLLAYQKRQRRFGGLPQQPSRSHSGHGDAESAELVAVSK